MLTALLLAVSLEGSVVATGEGGMYDSFVAFGDSFTEGLDDLRDDGSYRGWADLVAAELAGKTPGFRYANLAVRGRRLDRIRDEQLPRVEAMKPAMVGMTAWWERHHRVPLRGSEARPRDA